MGSSTHLISLVTTPALLRRGERQPHGLGSSPTLHRYNSRSPSKGERQKPVDGTPACGRVTTPALPKGERSPPQTLEIAPGELQLPLSLRGRATIQQIGEVRHDRLPLQLPPHRGVMDYIEWVTYLLFLLQLPPSL